MPLFNQRSLSTLTAGFRALQAAKPDADATAPAAAGPLERGRLLTEFMHHGGLYTLMNSDSL
jgi:hypothetical protein